jgi:hypothetical protein
MTPTKDQVNYARSLVQHRSTKEIEERMRKLERIRKGAGFPMYEALKIILLERKMEVNQI